MNENIDLTKILKDCPIGEEFYSPMLGDVKFYSINQKANTIDITSKSNGEPWDINADGTLTLDGFTSQEIMLYPSREMRDWSKFTAPWYKKDKFDPNTLKPFDKVLVRDYITDDWQCDIFSYLIDGDNVYKYVTIGSMVKCCIPYNDETKHLVGTNDEAPEYYRHWAE